MTKKYKKSPKGINVISHRFQPMEIDKYGKPNSNGVERFLLRYYFKNAIYGRAEYRKNAVVVGRFYFTDSITVRRLLLFAGYGL